jgi:hypothetical protein
VVSSAPPAWLAVWVRPLLQMQQLRLRWGLRCCPAVAPPLKRIWSAGARCTHHGALLRERMWAAAGRVAALRGCQGMAPAAPLAANPALARDCAGSCWKRCSMHGRQANEQHGGDEGPSCRVPPSGPSPSQQPAALHSVVLET